MTTSGANVDTSLSNSEVVESVVFWDEIWTLDDEWNPHPQRAAGRRRGRRQAPGHQVAVRFTTNDPVDQTALATL